MDEEIKPIIFDTTLREGFQTPGGIGATLEERIYAAALIQNYAHWVELGMPANNVDYNIIKAIRDRFLLEGYPVGIAVLARCNELDIERSAEVMANYPWSLIHLFVGTSDEHRSHRFGGKGKDFYSSLIQESVRKAAERSEFSRVMFSPEDSYRTFKSNPDTLLDFIFGALIGYEEGNRSVGRNERIIFNLPDTVGYSTISEFSRMIERVQKEFGENVELSLHGHNDNGMANAQAIHMFETYGVNWIQTTFGQLGERNGIASTDLVVKILADRGVLRDQRIGNIRNLQELDPRMHAILWALGREVPEEHGYRPNVSTAGIHTDLAIRSHDTYHIRGARYGSQIQIELGPTSGSKQVMDIFDRNLFPYDKMDKLRIEAFTDKLKAEANERKFPLSETHILYKAFMEFHGKKDDGLLIDYFEEATTSRGKTQLMVRGKIDDVPFCETYEANGPVEAAGEVMLKVINSHRGYSSQIVLESFKPRPIPKLGKDYLEWKARGVPKIPQQIGEDSDLAINLSFRNGSGVYHGWARHENSSYAVISAVFDGIQKMYALQKWMPKSQASPVVSS